MQIPKRKAEKKYTDLHSDPHITQDKFDSLQRELERKKKVQRPAAAKDVERYAKLGDFSENAAYSSAKGRLRGINNRILVIKDLLKRAVIIKLVKGTDTIQLGSTVTVEVNGKKKSFQILGTTEVNLEKGIISHNSPIGSELIGRSVGEIVKIKPAEIEIEYKIISID